MLIVVEELFGIHSLPFSHIQLKIKPTFVPKNELTLKGIIEKTKPGFFSKQVRMRPYSITDEIEYFMDISQDSETILYFYDPGYTSIDVLYRIRNLLLPERKLIPIPFEGSKGNKAELIYLIYTVSDWYGKQAQYIGYDQFLIHTQYFKSLCTPWSITSEIRPFTSDKKHQSIYKPLKRISYKQVYAAQNGKLKVHKAGELIDLWSQMLIAKTESKRVWVVRKGVSVELPDADFIFDLDNQTFPVNIPYIHAIFAPAK